ncbi:hypothetical protein JX266_008673 [Neoarthrinium moseri]|nr:hypothetical protein JX266_008673 [Neoarthrinium moseri]
MAPERQATWTSSTETFTDDLEDVCLNEDTKTAPVPLPPGDRPEVLNNVFHELLFVAVIAFATASSVFLQRSIVVIAADIASGLKLSPAEMAWVTGSSGLTTGAFLIPFGHLADICPVLSRKYLLILSLTAFSLIVAFSSFAKNGIVIDIMSGLAGVASAATIPIAVGLLSLVYPVPSRRKNIVFSSFLMGNPAATIIGGLGTGALASTFNWKATFIFLGILYALITVLSWVVVPNVSESRATPKPKDVPQSDIIDSLVLVSRDSPGFGAVFQRFDWLGLFLLLTGFVMFTVALTIGPEGTQPWKTPAVILLLTLGLLFLGCFVMWENSTQTPMVPPAVWENGKVILINLSALTSAMAYYSAVFWISMFLQKVQNMQPFDVAVRLLPQALMGLFFSPLVGLIMHRVPGTVLLVIAAFCSVLSNLLLIFLNQQSNYFAFIFPSLLLSTVGMDWTMNVGSLYTLAALPLEHHSIGASLLQTTTRLGVPLGMAVTTAVWSSFSNKGLDASIPYSRTFVTTAAFASFSLLLAPFIRIGRQGHSHSRELETQKVKKDEQDERRPSKRWSIVESISNKSSVTSPKAEYQVRSSSVNSETSTLPSSIERDRNSSRDASQSDFSQKPKIVWVVCEQCNASKRVTEPIGDPAKYFDDICGTLEKPNHDMIVNGRRRFPLAVKNPGTNR